MRELFSNIMPLLVLLSHVLFLIILSVLIIGGSVKEKLVVFMKEDGMKIGFFVALTAVIGSLFYSNIMGYEPCVLCWWQRVFIFPTLILFIIGLWKRDRGVFKYALVLASIAGVIAFYQSFSGFTGLSILPCTAEGGACSKVFVQSFGYITIPVMGLTSAVYLFLIAFMNRKDD